MRFVGEACEMNSRTVTGLNKQSGKKQKQTLRVTFCGRCHCQGQCVCAHILLPEAFHPHKKE